MEIQFHLKLFATVMEEIFEKADRAGIARW